MQFFDAVALLVQSSNYVTKRQSLKLLGEILLDRSNFKVMTRYIADEDNLKMMMNLLKDKSKNIQFEAFHVFKVSRNAPWGSGAEGRERTLIWLWVIGVCGEPEEAAAD